MLRGSFRKGFVIGIILLFLSTSIVSGINTNLFNNKSKKDYIINKNIFEKTDREFYNPVGNVKAVCSNEKMDLIWNIEEDRNFTYPIINGMVTLNCTWWLPILKYDLISWVSFIRIVLSFIISGESF